MERQGLVPTLPENFNLPFSRIENLTQYKFPSVQVQLNDASWTIYERVV